MARRRTSIYVNLHPLSYSSKGSSSRKPGRAKSPGLSSESPLEAGCLGRFQRPFSAQPGALSSRPFCWRLCQYERIR
ncbi:MAG: hypothetical protein DRI61_08755 [Chloroflexi bacterium]|nr:MAG: hypothetical protein DRI61_08755 [Chloroflexota bacterium]